MGIGSDEIDIYIYIQVSRAPEGHNKTRKMGNKISREETEPLLADAARKELERLQAMCARLERAILDQDVEHIATLQPDEVNVCYRFQASADSYAYRPLLFAALTNRPKSMEALIAASADVWTLDYVTDRGGTYRAVKRDAYNVAMFHMRLEALEVIVRVGGLRLEKKHLQQFSRVWPWDMSDPYSCTESVEFFKGAIALCN